MRELIKYGSAATDNEGSICGYRMYCTDCERHVSLTTGLRCMECGGGRIIATLDELARLGQEFDAAPEKEG